MSRRSVLYIYFSLSRTYLCIFVAFTVNYQFMLSFLFYQRSAHLEERRFASIGFAWERRRGGQIPGRIPGRVEYKGGRFRGTRKKEVGGFSFLSSREPWPSSRRFLLSKSLLQIIDDSPFFLLGGKKRIVDRWSFYFLNSSPSVVYIVFNWLSRCSESEAFDEGLRGMVHYAPLANSAYRTLYPSTQIGNSLVSFLI